mgnify:CR=1 FL=1
MRPSRAGASWIVGRVSIDLSEAADVSYVLLTHHHINHVAGLPRSSPRAVVANPFEAGMLSDEVRFERYVATILRRAGAPTGRVRALRVGVKFARIVAGWVDLDEFSAQVLPCGSHTWGHTCYKLDEGIFVGDLGGWIVNVNSLQRAISLLQSLGNIEAYPAHEPPTSASEYARRLGDRLKALLRAYKECASEGIPYEMALCARGGGDPLRLAEEGVAFAKYLAETGLVKLVVRSGRYYIKEIR